MHQAFVNWAEAYFGDDIDTIDIESYYDSTLSPGENIRLFKEQFPRQPASLRMQQRGSRAESKEQKVVIEAAQGMQIIIRIEVKWR